MRLRRPLVAIATSVLVVACGGSSQRSSSATPAAATPSATTTVAATPGPSATTTSSTSAPPEVPKTRTAKHQGGSHAVAQGAHVVVRMSVAANGDLSPSSVSVPAGVGVELHLTNHGNAARTVVLVVSGRPRARLGPGADGGLEAAGQRGGTYSILVDGTARGQLMSGAQGGP